MNSEGNHKSLQEKLRFKIGEQYELNEFNLKSLESTFSNGLEYENYEYIKDDFKALFGVKFSKNIILQYNADILCRVIYKFDKADYNSLFNKMTYYLSTKNKIIQDSSKKYLIVTSKSEKRIFLRMTNNKDNLIVSMS